MEYLKPQLPELTGPLIVSHSEAESAARCEFQHQLQYRERWSRSFNPDSAAGKGIAWHEVLEGHYLAIRHAQHLAEEAGEPWWAFDQEEALREARAVAELTIRDYEQKSVELGELLSWMYAGYVEMWGADPDWRILDVEMAGTVPLSPEIAEWYPGLTDQELPSPRPATNQFLFKYKVDLLIEENGKIWIVDHKSCHNFPSELDLDLDSQSDRYNWALRQEGYPVYGVLFNQARRRMLKNAQPVDSRHRRPRTYRTTRELDKIAEDLFQTVYARWAQQMDLERLGETRQEVLQERYGDPLPELAPIDAPRQVSSRHCSRVCDMTEACLAGRKGNDTRQFLVEENFRQDFTRH